MNEPVFSPETGHYEIQQKILASLNQNRLPHAYLFYGPEGSGKDALAIKLAQLLNCEKDDFQICNSCSQCIKIAKFQHPDIQFVFPTPGKTVIKEEDYVKVYYQKAKNPYRRTVFAGKNTFIGIDKIRELKREAGFKTYEGRRKVYIFSEADNMRTEAANAMLKMLEEPPANLMLILITANVHKILPTIKSRCQLLRFGPLPEEQIETIVRKYQPETDSEQLRLIIRLAGFNIKRTFDYIDSNVLEIREKALEYLRKLSIIARSQELMAIVEKMTGQRGRAEARQILWFLLIWFRDILHLKNGEDDAGNILNFDKTENLQAFISYAPNADIQKMVWNVEEALQALEDVRNFNPVLILTTLALKLNRQIRA